MLPWDNPIHGALDLARRGVTATSLCLLDVVIVVKELDAPGPRVFIPSPQGWPQRCLLQEAHQVCLLCPFSQEGSLAPSLWAMLMVYLPLPLLWICLSFVLSQDFSKCLRL